MVKFRELLYTCSPGGRFALCLLYGQCIVAVLLDADAAIRMVLHGVSSQACLSYSLCAGGCCRACQSYIGVSFKGRRPVMYGKITTVSPGPMGEIYMKRGDERRCPVLVLRLPEDLFFTYG